MGERLHVPVPAHAALPPRPRALRRRRRAPGVAVRRARRQQRHPGRRQPRLEARRSCCAGRRRSAARHATTPSASRRPTRTSSTRRASTDFITPKSAVSRTFRDAVLALARRHAFARRLVNSGRLSVPTVLADSPLNTPDAIPMRSPGAMVPGAPAADAPVTRPARRLAARLPRRRLHAARVRRRRRAGRRARARARHRFPCRVVQVGGAAARRPDRDRGHGGPGRRALRCDGPAPATCCGPTSTSARAGARSIRPPCAPRSRARPATPEEDAQWRALNTDPNLAAPGRLLRGPDRTAPRPDRRAERARQRQAHPAARQPHRRPRRPARSHGGGARGRRRRPAERRGIPSRRQVP